MGLYNKANADCNGFKNSRKFLRHGNLTKDLQRPDVNKQFKKLFSVFERDVWIRFEHDLRISWSRTMKTSFATIWIISKTPDF